MKDSPRSPLRAVLLLGCVLLTMLGFAAEASARSTVDLLADANIRIDGAAANDVAGFSVAGAGDVNADGRDDVIVGAVLADNNGRAESGSAYVIYGRAASDPRTGPIDLADSDGGAGAGTGVAAADGFRIDGAAAFDNAGYSVAGAGDVNADGRDDVIVGAYAADNNGRTDSGSAYVVFGDNVDPTAVDDAKTVDEDAPATSFDVLANDSDPDGGPKTIASVTQPANGTAVRADDGSNLSYRPNAGYCNSQPGGTPDTFTYTLNGGSQATVSVTVTCAPAVGPPVNPPVDPPALDTLAPSLTRLSLTNKRFVVRRVGRRRTPIGTRFRFGLSEAARVRITLARRTVGRRVGTRCVAPNRTNRRRKRCTRFVPAGTLTRQSKLGLNSIAFSGRFGKRRLKPGAYRATIVATDAAGNTSAPRRLKFTVLAR